MSESIKITVAEESAIIRKGLLSILKKIHLPDVELFEIDNASQLIKSLHSQRPDILIISTSLLGTAAIPRFRKEMINPVVKLVALQTSFVPSTVRPFYDEIITLGDHAQEIKEKLLKLTGKASDEKRQDTLSEREKEVLVCVVKGMTNKQIADKLCLSSHTVITHRRNISAKLDIHSTAGLTIYAIVNKLIEVE